MKKFKEYFKGVADPQTGQQWIDRFLSERGVYQPTIAPDPDGRVFDQIVVALQALGAFLVDRRQNKYACVHDHQYIYVEHYPNKKHTVILS